MAKKGKVDVEEEVRRLSRKTNYNMRKSEYSFDKQLKKLDHEIDSIMDDKLKNFDDYKKPTKKYLETEYSHDTVDRYREKLRKI